MRITPKPAKRSATARATAEAFGLEGDLDQLVHPHAGLGANSVEDHRHVKVAVGDEQQQEEPQELLVLVE